MDIRRRGLPIAYLLIMLAGVGVVLLAGLANGPAAFAEEAVAPAATMHEPPKMPPPSDRWAKHMQRFKDADAEQFPPAGATLFIGSSSIVGWDTQKFFPHRKTINRGFGGSILADSVHYIDQIVIPYAPRTIVLYAGDNDIAMGLSPRRVLLDYLRFVEKVHTALPDTKIIFVAIKPSIRRWEMVGAMREANALVRAVTDTDGRLAYVDVDTPMIGPDGQPRAELLKGDGLHMTPAGYEIWTSLVDPLLGPEPVDTPEAATPAPTAQPAQ